MFVSRSDVSFRCLDPARQLRDRREGDVGVVRRAAAGVGAVLRTKRVARRHRRSPGSIGFQCVAGAIVGLDRDLARSGAALEERRHRRAPGLRRHAPLGGVIVTCASFSASANVAGETAGPAAGAVPNVGGAPGVASEASTEAGLSVAPCTRRRRRRHRAGP